MRASKQYLILLNTIERNIKNNDSIVKITHTYILTHTYSHIHISKNYIIIMYNIQILCSYLYVT